MRKGGLAQPSAVALAAGCMAQCAGAGGRLGVDSGGVGEPPRSEEALMEGSRVGSLQDV